MSILGLEGSYCLRYGTLQRHYGSLSQMAKRRPLISSVPRPRVTPRSSLCHCALTRITYTSSPSRSRRLPYATHPSSNPPRLCIRPSRVPTLPRTPAPVASAHLRPPREGRNAMLGGAPSRRVMHIRCHVPRSQAGRVLMSAFAVGLRTCTPGRDNALSGRSPGRIWSTILSKYNTQK